MADKEVSCRITILDVNEVPIVGADVRLNLTRSITDINGRVLASTIVPTGTTLKVWHPSYVGETVIFFDDFRTGKYSNPLLRRVPSQNLVTLTLTLACYTSAPIKDLSFSEFTARAKRKDDVGAVIAEKASPTTLQYRDSNLFAHPLRLANKTLTPTPPLTPSNLQQNFGWDRFSTTQTSSSISPSSHGRIYWLTSHVSLLSPHPFAVNIWSPNFPTSTTPPSTIDIIFFYTPSTEWATATYPYGVVMFKPDPPPDIAPFPDQSYMAVGNRYMQKDREHQLVYPLAALDRKAVLIMPMNNKGKWDAVLSKEGVWRLCKEVIAFLHRENRFSSLGVAAERGVLSSKAKAGGSLRDYEFGGPRLSDFGARPKIGKMVVGFFSAGAFPAKWMMEEGSDTLVNALKNRRGELQNKYGAFASDDAFVKFNSALWGCRSGSGDAEGDWLKDMSEAWKETWDMDGFHVRELKKGVFVSIWPKYLELINKWHQESDGRVIRLCHSDGRRPRRILADKPDPEKEDTTGLWKRLLGSEIVYRSVGGLPDEKYSVKPIEEVQGRDWSVSALSSTYLEALPHKRVAVPEQWPVLMAPGESAHRATLKIAWSQFLGLSDVGIVK